MGLCTHTGVVCGVCGVWKSRCRDKVTDQMVGSKRGG